MAETEAQPTFTPGPWRHVQIESGEFLIVHPGTSLHPALLSTVGKMGLHEPDARLAAAGPEMYDALKAIALVWEAAMLYEMGESDALPDMNLAAELVVKVLAKVEGQS